MRLFKWEDESWSTVNLSAAYLKNDRSEAIPYFLIPSSKGSFSVYIECEGFQAVKHIGGTADGCWCGLVAYDRSKDGWAARMYAGCTITNYRASSSVVGGHPDAELNDCKFRPERCVESDFSCSFHMECEDDGYWALQAPPIQKSNDYNYIVSYGNYTEKVLEWGTVSISIDEVNSNGTASARTLRGRPRKPVVLQETVVPPPLTPRGAMGNLPGNQESSQTGYGESEDPCSEGNTDYYVRRWGSGKRWA